MEVLKTGFEGLVQVIPQTYEDPRGYFFEIYSEERYRETGLHWTFVQDNQSYSRQGVLRGLHFQKEPHAQGKLVMAISGKILDIAVDLRSDSATFGKYFRVVLDGKQHNQLFIPPGFAHGFLALEDSVFLYKCTQPYVKEADAGIIWNDPELDIDWGIKDPLVSEKDTQLPSFDTYKKSVGLS